LNAGSAPDAAIWLRIGAHVADVLVEEHELWGAGVNLAARLCTLARPGGIVVSAEVRDGLIDGFDAEIEDLGHCHLKHLDAPVRAYAIGSRPPDLAPRSPPRGPVLAVVPLHAAGGRSGGVDGALPEWVAEGLIARLSRHGGLTVLSSLSTVGLGRRGLGGGAAGEALRARYVVSLRSVHIGRRTLLSWELVEVASEAVIAADQLQTTVDAVLAPHGGVLDALAADVLAAIEIEQVRRTEQLPLPNLDSFAMQAGAIAYMHRASRESFERGRELLEALIERHPRQAAPRAWLAKWHVLRYTRGLVRDLPAHAQQALALTTQANEIDPEDAFALAVEGFVRLHMLRDFDGARRCYASALDHNANEPLAWLFSSVLHAFQGEGTQAVSAAARALTLSPLDPMRYFFDSLAATAELSAGQYAKALERAQQSYRRNRLHSSTLRVIAIAQVRLGRLDEAREAVQALRALEPELTGARYLARFPAAARETPRAWAEALCEAGLPAV
jgi:tetratricopeptide (TPR) repeat protein